MAEVLVSARVEGGGLSVVVHHPAFADLLDEPRARAALEVLFATLGEQGVKACVVAVSPAAHAPIDPFGLEQLRTFVRGLGVDVEPAADA